MTPRLVVTARVEHFAVSELLALLRAEPPPDLRTAAEIVRRFNGTGQRRLARIDRAESKARALARWARLRRAPGDLARRLRETCSAIEWMPLARCRLCLIAPGLSDR
jgi:hypothetical protein